MERETIKEEEFRGFKKRRAELFALGETPYLRHRNLKR